MAKHDAILYFLIPDPAAFQSGGNLYNLQLMEALKVEGVTVKRISPKDLPSIGQDESRKYLFVDTLYLDQIQAFQLKAGIAKILIVHHLESLYPPSGWTSERYFEHFEQHKLAAFDAYLCSSEYTKQYLSAKQFPGKRFIVVPPAIGFKTSTATLGGKKIKAILVANLIERKGILPFFEALAKLGKGPWLEKLKITIVGGFHFEPAYAKACMDLLQAHPELEKVIDLKGALPHAATLAAYQEANLFISTSFMETYGMAMQEALAFGLPVLALDTGNIRNHFINVKQGYLFGDMHALTEKLRFFCEFPQKLKLLKMELDHAPLQENYDWAIAARQLMTQLDF